MGDKNDLTARENEVLALAWQCFDNEPKVDMNKLAALTGYTPGSAAFTMGKIKRKLKNKTAGISADNPTPKKSTGRPRTKSSPAGKKNGNGKRAASSEEDDGNADATPSRRPKKAAKKTQDDEDDDEEFARHAIKKEEVTDLNFRACDFYNQLSGAAGVNGATLRKEGRQKRAAKMVKVPGLAAAFRRVMGR